MFTLCTNRFSIKHAKFCPDNVLGFCMDQFFSLYSINGVAFKTEALYPWYMQRLYKLVLFLK